jgi:hypothetical protein
VGRTQGEPLSGYRTWIAWRLRKKGGGVEQKWTTDDKKELFVALMNAVCILAFFGALIVLIEAYR